MPDDFAAICNLGDQKCKFELRGVVSKNGDFAHLYRKDQTPIKIKVETNEIVHQNVDQFISGINKFITKHDLVLYDQDLTQDLPFSCDFKLLKNLFLNDPIIKEQYTITYNKITGLSCFEFEHKRHPHIKCKFYDKTIYNFECSSLTSQSGQHIEAVFRCNNQGIECAYQKYGREHGMTRLEISYKVQKAYTMDSDYILKE